MLVGDITYYTTNGIKHATADRSVPSSVAAKSSTASTIACWECTNGNPRDVRWYRDGKQIAAPGWAS